MSDEDKKKGSGEGNSSESSSSSESDTPLVTSFGGRVVHNSKPDSESDQSDEGDT